MKQYVVYLSFLVSVSAFAQFTVSPFGAAGPSAPPNGDGGDSECGPGKSCSFEVTLKPFCFGTNLRAYPLEIQMDPTRRVHTTLNLESSTAPGQSDSFAITLPGQMTYDASGSHINCDLNGDQPLTQVGNRPMKCYIPWLNRSYDYTLTEWGSRINPYSTTIAHPAWSGEFVKYSGVGLPAVLNGGQGADIDQNITCLYRFTSYNYSGTVIQSSVNCYFPSRLPDLSSQIAITKNGSPVADAQVTAYVNLLKIKFKGRINSLPEMRPFKHGKMVLEAPPKHSLSFAQAGTTDVEADNGTRRPIHHVSEGEGFDVNNGYQSFTAQVKFPGMEGFCGGFYSPLMLFFDDKLPKFNGVSTFQLYKIPEGTPVNWPERNAPGHFLVRLKQGEKVVASYKNLFGQDETYANGFEALKVHDDNKDGVINEKDKIWSELYLWNDKSSDGFSDQEELRRPKDLGLVSIALAYTSKDETKFGGRALAREKGSFMFKKKGKAIKGNMYDLWFTPYKQQ